MTDTQTPTFEAQNNDTFWVRNAPGFVGYYCARVVPGKETEWFWTLDARPLSENHQRAHWHGYAPTADEAKAALLKALADRQKVIALYRTLPKPAYNKKWEDSYNYEEELICPYCGDATDDMTTMSEMFPDDFRYGDGEEAELFCSSCDKTFQVTLSVSYSFSTKPIEKDPEVTHEP